MAKINVQLATKGLPGNTTPTKLTPVMASASSAQNIRAPRVDVNAANVKYYKTKPPGIQKDSISAALEGGAMLADASFKYNQRREQVQADEAVVAFNNNLRNSLNGTQDAEGNFVAGYTATESKAAVESYSTYVNGIDQKLEASLEGLPEGVRKKALLRMNQSANLTKEQASKHRVLQDEVHAAEVQYQTNQDLMMTVKDMKSDAYNKGLVQQNLDNQYTTQEEKDTAAAAIAHQAYTSLYRSTLKDTQDPERAIIEARELLNSAESTLNHETFSKYQADLDRVEAGAKLAAKKQYKEVLKRSQDRSEYESPHRLVSGFSQDTPDAIVNTLQGIDALYPNDPAEASKKKTGALSDALLMRAMQADVNPDERADLTIDERVDIAREDYTKAMSVGEGTGTMTQDEKFVMDQFLEYDLPAKLQIQQKKKDDSFIYSALSDNQKRIEQGLPPNVIPPQRGMTPAKRKSFMAAQQAMVERGFDEKTITTKQDNGKLLNAKQLDVPLSEGEMDTAFDLVGRGEMSYNAYQRLYAQNQRMKSPSYKSPKYKQSPQYIRGKSYVASYKLFGAFSEEELPDKKDKDNIEDYTRIKGEMAKNEADALLSLNNAAEAHARKADGTDFNVDEWWTKHLVTLRGNQPIQKSFWSHVGDVAGKVGSEYVPLIPNALRFSGDTYKELWRDEELIDDTYGE